MTFFLTTVHADHVRVCLGLFFILLINCREQPPRVVRKLTATSSQQTINFHCYCELIIAAVTADRLLKVLAQFTAATFTHTHFQVGRIEIFSTLTPQNSETVRRLSPL